MPVKVGINVLDGRPQHLSGSARRSFDRNRRGERHHGFPDAGAPAEIRLDLGQSSEQSDTHDDTISVDGKSFKVFRVKDPAELDWTSVSATIVVESTGLFTKGADARSTFAAR